MAKKSESITENIFRSFYGNKTFIEKSSIPDNLGFKSKNDTNYKGYPDFYLEEEVFDIVVEAKASNHTDAINETKHYMSKNNIQKDIIGMAISGQEQLVVNYYIKRKGKEIEVLAKTNELVSLCDITKMYFSFIREKLINQNELLQILKNINKRFHALNIKDTERSLFFSAIVIALNDPNFYNNFEGVTANPKTEGKMHLECKNLNKMILDSVVEQIDEKVNNISKKINWRDEFSFLNRININLNEYKDIIKTIKMNVFSVFKNEEKYDILSRAYKIFLSRAGKIDNKNIILTPDHIMSFMVDLADLNKDDVVLDTCTGSGGFLIHSMEKLIELSDKNPNKIEQIKKNQLIGVEIDETLFSLACSNMFLHGDGRTNMIYGSSLLEYSNGVLTDNSKILLDEIKKHKPTKVIINPPYENDLPLRFVYNAMNFLENNGVLVAIFPNKHFFIEKSELRDRILDIATLETVIRMPNNLFSEQKRKVQTSIFVFKKGRHIPSKETYFNMLEDDGFISIQNKGKVDKNKQWPEIRKEILKACNNKDLNIFHGELSSILNKDRKFIYKKLYKRGNVKIGDIFLVERGSKIGAEETIVGEFDFITAAKGRDGWQKHNTWTHDTEAITFTYNAGGSLGNTQHVKGKFTASNLNWVLTPKDPENFPINLQFYKYYFDSIQNDFVAILKNGTSKPTISMDDFCNSTIKYIDINTQNNFIKNKVIPFKKEEDEFNKKEEEFNNAILNISQNLND